jgi:hypothetical protein
MSRSLEDVQLHELLAGGPPEELAALLAEWRWLPIERMRAVAVSRFGDLVLVDEKGAVHLLDTIAGGLRFLAQKPAAFEAVAGTAEGMASWFRAELVEDCRRAGIVAEHGECFSLRVPLVLGGQLAVTNVEVCDLRVHHALASQIADQVRRLPPGTRISGVEIVGD